MKTSFLRSSTNRFPLLLSNLFSVLTGAVFVCFALFLHASYAERFAFAGSGEPATAVIILLLMFVAATLLTTGFIGKSQRLIAAEKAATKQTEKALLQSEARFRDLFENANDLIYTSDLQGKFTSLNKVGEIVTGYSQTEFCRLNFEDIVAPEYLEVARQKFAEKITNHTPTAYELEIVIKSGERVPLELSNRVIFEAGKPVGVQGIGRDTTERRRAEQTLRESEGRYRAVTESASDAIITIDREQTILFVNKAAENIFGYSIGEMLGGKLSMLLPESLRSAYHVGMNRYAETEKGSISWQGVEFLGLHKNGSEIPLEITFGETDSGGRHFFTAVIRDITKRKQVEAELQKNLSLLTSTFEATADAILVIDRANQIVTCNRRFIDMTEMPDDIIASKDHGKSVDFVLSQLKDPAAFVAKTKELNSRPKAHSHDVIEFKDGRIYERYSHPQILDGEVIGRVVSFRNIGERLRAETALRQSEEKYRTILETIEEGYYETDLTGSFTFYNEPLADALRYEKSLQGVNFREYLDRETVEKLERVYRRVLVTRQPKLNLEYEVIRRDGTRMFAESSVTLVCGANDQPTGFRGVVRDVTERHRVEAALRESEYKFRTLLESMHEGVVRVSNDEVIEFVNDRFCRMTGFTREELLGKITFEMLFDEEGHKTLIKANQERLQGISGEYEISLGKKSGETFWALVGGAPIVNDQGEMTGTIGVFTDITERKRVERQMLHDAFHDGLTGLANRALFMDHLRMTIERGKSRRSHPYAVLFLDFDHFKIINDSLGHSEGDDLLKQIARRLESATRTGDLVARLGGDEFVVLLGAMLTENDAVQIAERIQENLKEPFALKGGEVYVSASIGIALSSAGHVRPQDMLRDADIAMYRAKSAGRAGYQVFDEAMHRQAAARLQMEIEMRQALERGEFEIYYQPIINLENNRLAGFEALARWIHPQRGVVSPMEFIPAAEENNLILPLGRWILQESCRQLRQWQIKHPAAEDLMVSVNLSGKQFLQPDLGEQITVSLAAADLAPRCLKLEITESYLIENSEKAVEIMERLRDIGVEISLDDFGTGYSSLSYLHRLPFDYLKIDRSFVSRIMESNENSEIVGTIIKLTHNLKMKVIAEGIETAEQLEHLKSLRCEYGQGYYLSKPVAAAAAESFIEENLKTDLPIFPPTNFGAEHSTQV